MKVMILKNSALIGDNEITTIQSDDGSDTFYFAGKELATALGYVRTRDVVTRHTKEWMRTTLRNIRGPGNTAPFVNIPGGVQPNRVFVTEPGLYSLVFGSRLPTAEDFQRWVFEDVLPSIRKTGTYTLPGVMNMIKGIDDMELQQLRIDDRTEARGELVRKGELVKNQRKVKAGRKGGLIAQENIRQSKTKSLTTSK
ncbi:Hypothetical predicted protein [Paramuricea clavata]|uniref:Uncharacterized protein n=1 Tax=Paramuricea clavata TaxID=317549 RepID=A0A7D9HPZ1_PARCT|nr:Hypothetical predicted protein [Paramuricea clavata]